MKTSSLESASPALEGRSSKTVVAGRGAGGAFLGISFMPPLSYIASGCVIGRRLQPDDSFRREEATMSATGDTGPHTLAEGIRVLRDKWGWIVALGVISMIAGVIALGSVAMATESAVLILGIMWLVLRGSGVSTASTA